MWIADKYILDTIAIIKINQLISATRDYSDAKGLDGILWNRKKITKLFENMFAFLNGRWRRWFKKMNELDRVEFILNFVGIEIKDRYREV